MPQVNVMTQRTTIATRYMATIFNIHKTNAELGVLRASWTRTSYECHSCSRNSVKTPNTYWECTTDAL